MKLNNGKLELEDDGSVNLIGEGSFKKNDISIPVLTYTSYVAMYNATFTLLDNGELTIGKKYAITGYVEGDDFTNIGASANEDGVIFTATGTTPSVWTNFSELTEFTTENIYVLDTSLENLNIDYILDESTWYMTLTSTSKFTENKTVCNNLAPVGGSGYPFYRIDVNTVKAKLNFVQYSQSPIEVRVYN